MNISDSVKAQILEHMRREGKTQVEVANALGVRPQSVNQVLAGKRSGLSEPLTRILDILDLELVVQPKEKRP